MSKSLIDQLVANHKIEQDLKETVSAVLGRTKPISLPQLLMLNYMREAPRRVGEVGDYLGMTQQAAGKNLKILKSRFLIEIEQGTADAREQYSIATDKGKLLLAKFGQIAAQGI